MEELGALCELDESALRALHSNLSLASHEFGSFLAAASTSCAQWRLDRLLALVVPVVFALICVLGIGGNALVLAVVATRRLHKTNTNVLIANLALSDLLFVTICVPPTAVDYAIGWPFGSWCCRIVQALIHATVYLSVYTLVLLSLDRFLAVVFPVRSLPYRTPAKALKAVMMLWLLVITGCLPLLSLFDVKRLDFGHNGHDDRLVCTFRRETHSEELFQVTFFVTSLAVPLTAISGLYVGMLLRLWANNSARNSQSLSRTNNRATNEQGICNRDGGNNDGDQVTQMEVGREANVERGNEQREKDLVGNKGVRIRANNQTRSNNNNLSSSSRVADPDAKRRRVTRLILSIIAVFAVCWTPLQTILLLRNLKLYDISTSGFLVVLLAFSQCLAYCNSCLNPILYAFLSPAFRKAFVSVFSGEQQAQQAQPMAMAHLPNGQPVAKRDDADRCEGQNEPLMLEEARPRRQRRTTFPTEVVQWADDITCDDNDNDDNVDNGDDDDNVDNVAQDLEGGLGQ